MHGLGHLGHIAFVVIGLRVGGGRSFRHRTTRTGPASAQVVLRVESRCRPETANTFLMSTEEAL